MLGSRAEPAVSGVAGTLRDMTYEVSSSEVLLDAPIIAVRRDEISTATGRATREIVEHFSAVAIAAVRTTEGSEPDVMMIRQYRHGVGRYLWEIPAGLLDKVGESPIQAACRELAEEAGLVAGTWHLLGDVVNSPGFCEEMCRIYLAEDISENTESALVLDEQTDEEADLERRWVPVSEAIEWVKNGTVENSVAVAALLHLAVGTRRDINDAFAYKSGLAARRSHLPVAAAGTDMKFLVGE